MYTCAQGGGALLCRWSNDYGQTGDTAVSQPLTPVDVAALSGCVAVISAGGTHSRALTDVGGLRYWVDNTLGQIEDNSLTNRLIPVAIRSGQSISFAPPATAASGTALIVTAPASSALTVAFDTWTPTTCSVSGATLSIISAPIRSARHR